VPLHLAEIALAAAPGAHAGLLTDQVGRHMTASARSPANTSIIARCRPDGPSRTGREHPAAHAGQPTIHHVFPSCDAIVDHCCKAWNSWRSTLAHSRPHIGR